MTVHLGEEHDRAAMLEKLIAGIESGEIRQFTLRVTMRDGTVRDIQFGYEKAEDRDAAIARLVRLVNEIH